jgi:hypothetical protein
MAYDRDDQYTQWGDEQFLVHEDLHKNSDGDLIKVVRVYQDKWKPGVEPDITYTKVYEQRDAGELLLGAENVTARIVRVYFNVVRS